VLLEVPAGYGGCGAWIDHRHHPQLARLLERCREDMALHRGAAPSQLVASVIPPGPRGAPRRDRFRAGLFDGEGEMSAVVQVVRNHPASGAWWLGAVLVRPDLRGCGIGGSVIEALEEWVRAEGGGAIHLELQRRNAGALAFARRTGFVEHRDGQGGAATARLVRSLG
jgi:GNAT superfamily N-acetyltransferase